MSGENTSAPLVAILATCDTKQAEADFLASALRDNGLQPVFIDTTIRIAGQNSSPEQKIHLMKKSADNAYEKLGGLMSRGLAGAIGLGGGTGTWVCVRAMEKLAFGWPKIIVSTLAYDIRASIATNDIILIPSIADIQGLNPTLRTVLENAAASLSGLVKAPPIHCQKSKPVIGITALGVTNDAVTGISEGLVGKGYEVTTFHATGMGGRAFERWISEDKLDAVLDLTTQELHGLSFGAPITCDNNRLLSAGKVGVPQLIIPGGIDFIARGRLETLTAQELTRPRFCHSPEYTHIRATYEQVVTTTKIMVERLNKAIGLVKIVIPLGGFSVEGSRPDGAMWDPELCNVFASTLTENLKPEIPVILSPEAITSPAFHNQVLDEFITLLNVNTIRPELT